VETRAAQSSTIAHEAGKAFRPARPEIVIGGNGHEMKPLVAALGEEDYRKALLVETVVNTAPELLSREAVRKAELGLTGEVSPEKYVIPVSEVLLEHLPSAYRNLAGKPIPWQRIRVILPLLAFLVGVMSNVLSPLGVEKHLGPQRIIHVFVNPVVVLLLWNIAVVGFFILFHRRPVIDPFPQSLSQPGDSITARRKTRQEVEPDWPLWARITVRPVLRLWARFVEPAAEGVATAATHAKIAGLFLTRYFRTYRRPIIARLATVVNLSAICLAAGAIAGMYFQAVIWDYSFFWRSTLIGSPETRLIILKVLFWPAALLLGHGFPDVETIAAMANGPGAPGAVWIHVFAITSLAYIFLPRLALIYRSVSETCNSSAASELTIDFIRLREQKIENHSGTFQPGEFLDRSRNISLRTAAALDYFSLDANAMSVLLSLQSAMLERDIENTGGDNLKAKRTWYLEWLKLMREGFADLPEVVRPTLYPIESGGFHAALESLSQSRNPFARDLVALELAAFEAYWPLSAEKKGWTERLAALAKSTPSLSREVVARSLENAALQLGLSAEKGPQFRSEMESINRSLSGYWKNIAIIAGVGTLAGALTFGIAAPVIGGLIGHSLGLAGAAAVKAGLAALGGGAIVSHGMGIAGGTAVLVGGGALLGMGVGGSLAAASNPAGVLVQTVKIEVFLRCIAAESEKAEQVVKNVLAQLEASISRMHDELENARRSPKTDSGRIEEIEAMIKILGTCRKRCSDWAREKGFLDRREDEAPLSD